MSYRWPNKDPDETKNYSIDWSRYLGTFTITSIKWYVQTSEIGKTRLPAGDTLTTASSYTVTDSIQNISQTNTDTVATIYLGSGELNRQYIFTCNMTDSGGNTSERTVKLTIREN